MVGNPILTVLCGLLSVILVGTTASKAAYPDRPVHFIVGFTASGGTDTVARVIGQKLSEMWGQSVIVENRPGADGSIATDVVAHAKPDGYTIAWISNSHTITPNQYKLNYDPIKSFEPITMSTAIPDLLVVNPAVPVKTMKELVAYAKANPNKLNFGSAGTGTPPYLEMVDFMNRTRIAMTHVPYKGSSEATAAILGTAYRFCFSAISSSLAQARDGKLTVLGISSKARSALAPEVPTIAEAADLPGFSGGVWEGALAPAGTPKEVVSKLYQDIVAAVHLPEVKDRFAKLGIETIADTPEQFVTEINADTAKWAKVLKAMNTAPEH